MNNTYQAYKHVTARENGARPSYRRALSNPQFSLIWFAQLISQSGDYVLNLALVWFVLQITGSALSVGETLGAALLPNFVVGPIAGVYIDRYNRRDLMLVSNLTQALTVLTIAVMYGLGRLSFVALLCMTFLLNAQAQFFRPAVVATIPQIVSKQDLVTSNSLMSVTTNLNQVAGYGIGGVVVALFGISAPLYYDCMTFLVASLLLIAIQRSGCKPAAFAVRVREPRNEFREGLTFVRSSRILTQLAVVGIFIHLAEAAAYSILAPFTKNALSASSATYGFLLAMISVGTVCGSALLGRLSIGKQMGKLLLLGIFGMGVGFAILGKTQAVWSAAAASLAIGVSTSMVSLPIQVLLQTIVPNRLLGRVGTSLVALFSASQPVGSILAGSIATTLTPGLALSLTGLLIIISIGSMSYLFNDLRSCGFKLER